MGKILENPIVVREWRGLGRRLRDWRLWIGVRMPREPAEWGLPAIAWFGIAPYVLWVLLLILRRADPTLIASTDVDLMPLFLLGLAFYTCAVSVTVGALTISREREQGRWDDLCVTPMAPGELVLGFWFARATPIMGGVAVSVLVWLALFPHYHALLEALGPFTLDRAYVLLFGAHLVVQIPALTAVGVLFSARCARSIHAAVGAGTFALCLAAFELLGWTLHGTIHTRASDNGSLWITRAAFCTLSTLGALLLAAASLRMPERRKPMVAVGVEAAGETA